MIYAVVVGKLTLVALGCLASAVWFGTFIHPLVVETEETRDREGIDTLETHRLCVVWHYGIPREKWMKLPKDN